MADDRVLIEVGKIDKFWDELWAYLRKIDHSIKNNNSEISKISEFRVDDKTNYIIFPENLLEKQGNLLWNYIKYKDRLDDFDPEKLKNALFDAAFKVKDINGDSALHWAIEKKDKGTIDTLLKTGTPEQLFLRNNFGETALHYAIAGYDKTVIEVLINKGNAEQLFLQDTNGQTALHLATIRDDEKTALALIEKGKSEQLLIPDNSGFSAMDIAIAKQMDNVITAIVKKVPYNEIKKYKSNEVVAGLLAKRANSITVEEIANTLQTEPPQQLLPIERCFKIVK